jgi:phage terminase Nu1 subunit (DNA packaging protein)
MTPRDRAELAADIAAQVRESLPLGVQLVDRTELARRLSCSPSLVEKLQRDGMPRVQIGTRVVYEPTEVIAWLRGRKGTDAEAN